MKTITIMLAAFLGMSIGQILAQSPNTSNKEKMEIFSNWTGHWQGEGSMKQGPGEAKRSVVDEYIELKLEGNILLIEGIGKSHDPATQQDKIVHHALGILSFDANSGTYQFKSYLNNGRSTEAWFNVTAENNFEWGFDIPTGGKTKYSIRIDPVQNTWNEIGKFSRDGTTWMKFFEMNLKKVAD